MPTVDEHEGDLFDQAFSPPAAPYDVAQPFNCDDEALAATPVLVVGTASLTPSQQRDLRLASAAWLGHTGRPGDQLGAPVLSALARTGAGRAPVGAR